MSLLSSSVTNHEVDNPGVIPTSGDTVLAAAAMSVCRWLRRRPLDSRKDLFEVFRAAMRFRESTVFHLQCVKTNGAYAFRMVNTRIETPEVSPVTPSTPALAERDRPTSTNLLARTHTGSFGTDRRTQSTLTRTHTYTLHIYGQTQSTTPPTRLLHRVALPVNPESTGSSLIHQKVAPPTEGQGSPVLSFITLEQFNAIRLVQSIHQSLAALSKVIRGTQLLTPEVQKLATALLNQEVRKEKEDSE
nr:PREDICTED: uncharacterized protein LOC104961517 [Notothenia coriiceps]